jgi:prepilin-type N-terminal cleavage/methylation domain-containing protein
MIALDEVPSAHWTRTLCGNGTRGLVLKGALRAHGFTLIELMLVVTIVGILTSVAMPSLTRARSYSNEVSTIGSLRALNTAQASYASSCGGGAYAPTVASLATPATGIKGKAAPFIGPGFTADTIDKAGFRIRFTKGVLVATAPATCNGIAKGQAVQSYYIAGDPLYTGPGMPIRYFGTSSGGTIYQSTKRVTAFYSGAAASPAKPIQ